MKIRRILVAVHDLTHPPGGALRKAATLARAAQADIELYHAVEVPDALGLEPAAMERLVQSIMERDRKRLARLARLACFDGLQVQAYVGWDQPSHEAIVRRALGTRADLVIAGTRTRGVAGRIFLRNTDWELIRQCPCALLLVKSAKSYGRPVVLAALDPFHTHSKPADLDLLLLEWGADIARLLNGSLHAFHSYLPMMSFAPVPAGPAIPLAPPPEAEAAHGELIARAFDRLASRADIPPRARHLHMGPVADELSVTAGKLRAGIVVMGAVSRSGLRRIFIGSTAERALDELRCDVLVIKPRAFKTDVHAGPVRARGHRSLS